SCNGFEVFTAKDGVDAIATLQDHIPDLMLLDIEMPRMDGFEVASVVRHDSRLQHVPIIMITSRTGDKHRNRALSIGVNEYLGKPFQEDKLLSNIEKLLAGAAEN
ncbi:MAG: response regulator, partial [Oleispira sp.]|nr:response regulator [Oleispira sp.]